MLYVILGVVSLILDQWVKYWAAANLVYGGDAKVLIPGLVNLVNVHNEGAAFSILSGANAGKYFVILAVVLAALVVVGLVTNFISGRLARWCAVFVAAGGIGNAIDRLMLGYVQDMFQFDFAKNFPVFNVADIFICVFCLLFILCVIFGGRSTDEDEDYEEEEAPRRAGRSRVVEEEEEEEAPRRSRRPRVVEEEEEEEAPRRSRRPRVVEEEEEEEAPRRYRRPRVVEEEEEEAPRRSRRPRVVEEEEEETPRPQRPVAPKAPAPAKNAPSAAVREAREFERLYSEPQSNPRVSPNAPEKKAPAASAEDPFAAWEKARAAAAAPTQKAAAPAPKAAVPAQKAPTPAPKAPQPAPAPQKPVSDSFDLDDILAEFK